MGFHARAVAGIGIKLGRSEAKKLAELGLEELGVEKGYKHSRRFIQAMAEKFPGISREITDCLRLQSVCMGGIYFLTHKDAVLRTRPSGRFEVESCQTKGFARAVSQLEIAGKKLSLKGKPKVFCIQDYF